ncbi:MAG: flavodoxin domain-containing protein [Tepidanaerobacteraceae bacterium]|jgi:menaquinone-dependent protoporphyrinogen IX oxidase|nr:flavodoxin domain-containing protein [Tepidanaerobacteraceae bacterium]
MKTIVIYKSKTGFTKKYAEWIAEELSADIFEASRVSADMLEAYDIVIYGGGLYAVGINGVKLITKNLDRLHGKKVVVFATGMSPRREETIAEIRSRNFTSEQLKTIRFFYLRGGFDYGKLKPFDRILMTLLKWKIQMKKELTPDEKGMLAVYDRPADFRRKEDIGEIISHVTSRTEGL